MAYYNHEAFPWPRPPVMEQNDYYPYEGGYADPRSFYQETNSSFHYNPGSDNCWQSSTNQPDPRKGHGSKQKEKTQRKAKKTAKVMKNSVIEGISRPVESSKAERMMQMMGWQGGALGKTGSGLKEPLAPNLTLQSGAGLGHGTEEKVKVKPPPKKQTKKSIEPTGWQQKKQTKKDKTDKTKHDWKPRPKKIKKNSIPNNCPIRSQILTDLLAFVKDNKRIEMKFDPSLTDSRRKLIHRIVENIKAEDIEMNSCSLMHPEISSIFTTICECNEYVLQSQSEGERPMRQICVFKEAAAHVFLIIKDDLEEEEEDKGESQSCKNNVDVIAEDKINIDQEDKIELNDTIQTTCKEDTSIVKPEASGDKSVDMTTNHASTANGDDGNAKHVLVNPKNDPVLKTTVEMEDVKNVGLKIEQGNEVKTLHTEEDRYELVKALLKNYLEEFFAATEYTEMRFLGEFGDVEQTVINEFITNMKECLCDVVTENNWLIDTVLDHKYAVQFDNNGAEIIVKC